MKKTLLLCTLLVFLLPVSSAFCEESASILVTLDIPVAEPGALTFAAAENAFARQAGNILAAAPVTLEEMIPLPYLGLAILRTSGSPEATLEGLRNTEGVQSANLPGKSKLFTATSSRTYIPTEPLYSDQWYLPAIGCPEAWDTTKGDSSMIAAVLDTGVDYGHPDLAASMWTNPGEIPNNNVDDDGNGIVDDYYGMAAYGNGSTVTGNPDDILPDGGHGTHVAGSIAAPINGVGILGVAPNVKIMGLRSFTYDSAEGASGAWDTDVAVCLNYILAMKNRGINIKAVNCSFGGDPGETPYESMRQAYQRVADAGILIFIAAGNENNDNDWNAVYPANYEITDSVVVGATGVNDTYRASFSNYGASTVDIFAPGSSILSTVPTFVNATGYDSWNGTSMATPVTLGAGMLTWSANPGLSASQVRTLLLQNGTDSAALAGLCVTGKVVNAASSVAAAAAQVTTTPTPTTAPTTTATPTKNPTSTPGASSGGGGGCSMGFAFLGSLLFLFPLLLVRTDGRK